MGLYKDSNEGVKSITPAESVNRMALIPDPDPTQNANRSTLPST